MSDLIDRQAAIDALEEPCKVPNTWTDEYAVGQRMQWEKDVKTLNSLPSAQPEVIACGSGELVQCEFDATTSTTLTPVTGKWIWNADVRCSNCGYKLQTTGLPTQCPNCGAKMEK